MRILPAALLTVFVISGAHAQDALISNGPNGCTCSDGDASWPCRKMIDYTHGITCNANLNPVLECPDDKSQPCFMVNRPTCSEPQMTEVCWSKDKPQR